MRMGMGMRRRGSREVLELKFEEERRTSRESRVAHDGNRLCCSRVEHVTPNARRALRSALLTLHSRHATLRSAAHRAHSFILHSLSLSHSDTPFYFYSLIMSTGLINLINQCKCENLNPLPLPIRDGIRSLELRDKRRDLNLNLNKN